MEQAGTIPRGLIDVSEWAELYSRPGPTATICLGTPGAVENASSKNRLRWQDARRSLEAAGAPPSALDPVEEVIVDAHRLGEGVAIFSDASGIQWVEHSPVPPRHELLRWDSLVSISPVLNWRQHQPPYVVALVDHQGADLLASGSGVTDHHEEAGVADRYPVARNAPGGWSQGHYQQHAVENWADSARQVAAALGNLVDRVDPDIVLVGGDPRSVELLMGALPAALGERVEHISGTRAADGGGDSSAREVARMVETVAARQTVEVIEEFRAHLGRGARAVEGVGPTLEALRQARVAALVVHDDPGDDRRASFGPEATAVAVSSDQLEGVGSGPVSQGRLVDVALRAAAGSGATARVVPSGGGPQDGLGALLRWAD